LNELQTQYGDRVALYVVYIQEAHPIDGWQMGSNVRDGILFRSTSTLAERSQIAGTCLLHLGIKLPALVDLPDDRVERAYTAWPDRLYVVDMTGRVAYKSAPGPFGFEPKDLKAVLDRLLGGT
jgi:type I thyroxine 5'-deiodinase